LLRLAQRADDPALAVIAPYTLGATWLHLGALPTARQHLEAGITRYTPATPRLPRVELRGLLMEVDTWPHCSSPLRHAAPSAPRRPAFFPSLDAGLLAQACHFGLDQKAHRTARAYERLAGWTTWHRREEPLKPAFSALVH